MKTVPTTSTPSPTSPTITSTFDNGFTYEVIDS